VGGGEARWKIKLWGNVLAFFMCVSGYMEVLVCLLKHIWGEHADPPHTQTHSQSHPAVIPNIGCPVASRERGAGGREGTWLCFARMSAVLCLWVTMNLLLQPRDCGFMPGIVRMAIVASAYQRQPVTCDLIATDVTAVGCRNRHPPSIPCRSACRGVG